MRKLSTMVRGLVGAALAGASALGMVRASSPAPIAPQARTVEPQRAPQAPRTNAPTPAQATRQRAPRAVRLPTSPSAHYAGRSWVIRKPRRGAAYATLI